MPVVHLPRLLAAAMGDTLKVETGGATLGQVLDDLLSVAPQLRVHLFDEWGDLRPHVSCFVDGTATRLTDRSMTVTHEVRFVQAVSGG